MDNKARIEEILEQLDNLKEEMEMLKLQDKREVIDLETNKELSKYESDISKWRLTASVNYHEKNTKPNKDAVKKEDDEIKKQLDELKKKYDAECKKASDILEEAENKTRDYYLKICEIYDDANDRAARISDKAYKEYEKEKEKLESKLSKPEKDNEPEVSVCFDELLDILITNLCLCEDKLLKEIDN